MCRITDAKPVRVHGTGLHLPDKISEKMHNYR